MKYLLAAIFFLTVINSYAQIEVVKNSYITTRLSKIEVVKMESEYEKLYILSLDSFYIIDRDSVSSIAISNIYNFVNELKNQAPNLNDFILLKHSIVFINRIDDLMIKLNPDLSYNSFKKFSTDGKSRYYFYGRYSEDKLCILKNIRSGKRSSEILTYDFNILHNVEIPKNYSDYNVSNIIPFNEFLIVFLHNEKKDLILIGNETEGFKESNLGYFDPRGMSNYKIIDENLYILKKSGDLFKINSKFDAEHFFIENNLRCTDFTTKDNIFVLSELGFLESDIILYNLNNSELKKIHFEYNLNDITIYNELILASFNPCQNHYPMYTKGIAVLKNR